MLQHAKYFVEWVRSKMLFNDLPMIPAFGTRTGDGTQFDVEFDAAIRPSDSLTMTQDFNHNLSARIHANPDQWYWMLRRWKGA